MSRTKAVLTITLRNSGALRVSLAEGANSQTIYPAQWTDVERLLGLVMPPAARNTSVATTDLLDRESMLSEFAKLQRGLIVVAGVWSRRTAEHTAAVMGAQP
jgi:hypothetical protein